MAEQFVHDLEYESVYQLTTFHLEKAIAAYRNTEHIPQKNIETMQQLSLEKIKKIRGVFN